MKKILVCLILTPVLAFARTLEVGAGKQYTRLQAAAAAAVAGDTILMRAGMYSGGDAISNLQGTAAAWITIRAATGEAVIFRGGSQAFQISDAAYVRIEDLTFEQQTGNGVNMDDAGTLDTPSHHIVIERCVWLGMNATGNNDELKMSGIDDFTVRKCRFLNGSAGGSQIDMVGCHRGIFAENYFENGGSNCIQAKGGSSRIFIERNKFINGGERAINIGGSTGIAFFRPPGINYEASEIYVYSNIFVGSTAPIAFVGAVNCEVRNNTIFRPGRWAIRILQETVGNGFLPCGDNIFSENIVVFATGQPVINIGGNTAPETFTFGFNLWFNPDNPSWQPGTPTTEVARLVANPKFADTVGFYLQPESPAIGSGSGVVTPSRDFYAKEFAPYTGVARNRARGAVEYYSPTSAEESSDQPQVIFATPNPASTVVRITMPSVLQIFPAARFVNTITGASFTATGNAVDNVMECDVTALPAGSYIFEADGRALARVVIFR